MRNIDSLMTQLVEAASTDDALKLANGYTPTELRGLADLLYIELPDSPRKATIVVKVVKEARS